MSLLREIMAAKVEEVAQLKAAVPVAILEMSGNFGMPCRSMREALNSGGLAAIAGNSEPSPRIEDSPTWCPGQARTLSRPESGEGEFCAGARFRVPSGIIAEIKRRSPSKGELNTTRSIAEIAKGYAKAGASGISVLTDEFYFGGSLENLRTARAIVDLPILRKDFILDEYQVIETKSIGADVLLLIAAALRPGRLRSLARLARSLGLETLLEIHSLQELEEYLCEDITLVGVNSRNLSDLSIDPNLALDLANSIPDGFTRVAESGLKDPAQLHGLRQLGYKGFLIGERFMATDDPGQACRDFIRSLEAISC